MCGALHVSGAHQGALEKPTSRLATKHGTMSRLLRTRLSWGPVCALQQTSVLKRRGFSDSVPTTVKSSRRSPELRHQLVVVLLDLRPESASEGKNAASFRVYLYWAFSGVTLGKQIVPLSA